MDDAAIRWVKEAVVRALLKSPEDVGFYYAQVDDSLRKPQYRKALQEAIDESRQLLKSRQEKRHQRTA